MANKKLNSKEIAGKVKEFKIKDFFALLKRLVKEPVNNVKEVEERQKEAKPVLIVGAIVAAAGGIVSFVGSLLTKAIAAVGMIFSLVGYAVTFAGLICLIFWLYIWINSNNAKKRFQDLECPNCGETIEDEKATYKELQRYTKTSQDQKHVYLNEYTEVEISCKCQKCGTEKNFKHTFVTERYVDGKKSFTHEIGDEVVKYLFSRRLG
ncbi:MAG: hypothetical protein J6Q64_03010 [Clostridia bacterium]|nr:hypothetical protein [Clostridia bacterium]